MAGGEAIWLANPRGFCAGVERAIEIVSALLERHGAPIYVKHEVVHNTYVIERLAARGARFIEDVGKVPEGSVLVFSAHGVSQAVRRAAAARGLRVYDATCPLVSKVHAQVQRLRKDGFTILMIGHAGHPEVEGTMGQVDDGILLVESVADVAKLSFAADAKLAYVTQTTLSVDETREIIEALRARWPAIQQPAKEDICYATQNRQDAVKGMAAGCALVIVVGSATSSNSNRLCEVARKHGARAELVDGPDDIEAVWLAGDGAIGVTAGASAPEEVIASVIARLRELRPGAAVTELPGVEEDVAFAVPGELRRPEAAAGR
ncbi:MAG: 4-hydroxy-3-methylbut-2-enyl diphosphate reductase [Betaproteobacteria bacterium AqS2]|uniref:4-hydroxy-3-methylbut-2-enyl diphosphate reductase n=1 Tax=Candidatus Amphirhobacter heronislandensis TaxID=1732024 RepID=A0A930XYF6_9GAMM|nr:4-hydroxy-3-methylbut-2-enyl diphosphate reductase [Betaproteobacteria bacterium AqS2]